MTELITKDMTIGDVVQKYPQVTDTLTSNGVHCVGCGARFFETLEMGFKGHGMDDEKVTSIIKQLNEVAKENPVEGELVLVTEKAAEKLKEVMKKENKEGYCLRMQAVSSENGLSYGLDIVNDPKEDDTIVEAHGIKFIADPEALPLVKGAKIDYVEGEQAGFRISNSSQKQGCGCH